MHPAADSLADFRFSEQTLADLLEALRARAASHPDNPGIIASWPGVQQHSMAAACNELERRGYPVEPVSVAGWAGERTRSGWALGTSTASVVWHPPMHE
jgi:hypothetical protein